MSKKPSKTEKPAKAKLDDAQIERFKQTARDLACDETGEQFERAFAQAVPAQRRSKNQRA